LTKTKKIGYVASFPIPEVIRDINAIQLALNKYNPGTEIKVVWVNSWPISVCHDRLNPQPKAASEPRG
jgi:basic membrane lipoprotein Med (substrate-binding protein (PBP1-ABC) superfamily)